MLDKFIQVIEENDLQPEDIQSITAQPHPVAKFPFSRENNLITEGDYCFHAGYLLACAAHRINPSRWHDPDVKQDPRIQRFLKNTDLRKVIDEQDFIMAKRENPMAYQTRMEVVAKGKTFNEKAVHPKGGWFSEEFRNTDEELIKKFTDNATKIMSLDKASKAARTIFELEKLGNAKELLVLVAP